MRSPDCWASFADEVYWRPPAKPTVGWATAASTLPTRLTGTVRSRSPHPRQLGLASTELKAFQDAWATSKPPLPTLRTDHFRFHAWYHLIPQQAESPAEIPEVPWPDSSSTTSTTWSPSTRIAASSATA